MSSLTPHLAYLREHLRIAELLREEEQDLQGTRMLSEFVDLGAGLGALSGTAGAIAGRLGTALAGRVYHGVKMKNDPHEHAAKLMQKVGKQTVDTIDAPGTADHKGLRKSGGIARGALSGAIAGGVAGQLIARHLGTKQYAADTSPLVVGLSVVSNSPSAMHWKDHMVQGQAIAGVAGLARGIHAGIHKSRVRALETLKKKNPEAFKKAKELAGMHH